MLLHSLGRHCRSRGLIVLLTFAATASPLAALRAQSPPPELRAIAARPDVWPREVVLKTAAPAPNKNAPPVPAGTTLKVAGLEGPLIDLDYQDALIAVPIAQTDFLERASARLAASPSAPPARAPLALRTAAAPPSSRPTAAPAFVVQNALGIKLAPALMAFDHSGKVDRLIPSAAPLATKKYLLLQLGGGRSYADAIAELTQAVQAARAAGGNFETVLVPKLGGTAQGTIKLIQECGYSGPVVDPRQTAVVNQLWAQYGHAGTFALALVDAQGQIVSQTSATERGIDKFHSVLGALAQTAAH